MTTTRSRPNVPSVKRHSGQTENLGFNRKCAGSLLTVSTTWERVEEGWEVVTDHYDLNGQASFVH